MKLGYGCKLPTRVQTPVLHPKNPPSLFCGLGMCRPRLRYVVPACWSWCCVTPTWFGPVIGMGQGLVGFIARGHMVPFLIAMLWGRFLPHRLRFFLNFCVKLLINLRKYILKMCQKMWIKNMFFLPVFMDYYSSILTSEIYEVLTRWFGFAKKYGCIFTLSYQLIFAVA